MIGLLLKSAAKEKGMTLRKVAEISGIPVNTIYDKAKRDPVRTRPDTLVRLAKALEIPVVELLPPSQRKRFAELEGQAEAEYKKRDLEEMYALNKPFKKVNDTKEHIQLRLLFKKDYTTFFKPLDNALFDLYRSNREIGADTLTEALAQGVDFFLKECAFSADVMEIANIFLSLNEDGQYQAKKLLRVFAGNPMFTK